jgi:hypothetical protein
MKNPQTQSPQPRTHGSHVELEWLAGQLADEAEYWRARAEAAGRAFDELIRQVELVGREQSSIRTQSGPSAGPLDEALGLEPPSFRNAALVLLVSLIVWACIALGALAAFRYLVV